MSMAPSASLRIFARVALHYSPHSRAWTRFSGSVFFGILWTWQGDRVAVSILLTGLFIAILMLLAFRKDRDVYTAAAA
jgi:hypothetical protein